MTQEHLNSTNAMGLDSGFKLFALLKPNIFIDGNQWCVLYGTNLQEGIAGFGDTPAAAICDWHSQWYKRHKPEPVQEKKGFVMNGISMGYFDATIELSARKEIYDYVKFYSSAHFLKEKNLFSAHITIHYDYQCYGNSQEEATNILASYLASKLHLYSTVRRNNDDVVNVTERIYRESNPDSKMNVPSYAYEQVKAADNRRIASGEDISLYKWCKREMKNHEANKG